MAFDLEGARRAGYSDDEIAQHLSETRKFDYEGAKKAGYSSSEIIDHLSTSASPVQTAPPNPVTTGVSDAVQAVVPGPESLKPIAPTVQPGLGNVPLAALQSLAQTIQSPLRAASVMRQPGQVAGQVIDQKLSTAGHPIVGKVAGIATETALDPTSYVIGGQAGKSLDAVEKFAVTKAGEEAAAAASALSGVKEKAIKRLFENPIAVLLSKSTKKAGAELGLAKKAAGITEAEEFLIAKAGDRSVGGARTVADELLPQFKADPTTVTTGQLVALRRGLVKLASDAKGSEKALYGKYIKTVGQELDNRAPQIGEKLQQYALSMTRAPFLNIVPRKSVGTGGDFFRTLAALPLLGASTPAAVGIGTVAAKAGYSVAKPVLKPIAQLVNRAAPSVGLTAIRKYLQNQ